MRCREVWWSGGKLYLGGAHDLVAKITAEVLGGTQIDASAEQPRKLGLDRGNAKQPGDSRRLELHQQVYVAVRLRGAFQDGAEQRQAPDAVASAQLREGLLIERQPV